MLENCHKFKESYYNVMKTAPKNVLQVAAKISRTGEFYSGIVFTICTNQVPLPKNGRESLKVVSKMRFHQRNTHFRLEHSVRKNGTTFPDVLGWSRKFSANTTPKFVFYVLFSFSPPGRSHLSNHVVRRGSYQKIKLKFPTPARNGQKWSPILRCKQCYG